MYSDMNCKTLTVIFYILSFFIAHLYLTGLALLISYLNIILCMV